MASTWEAFYRSRIDGFKATGGREAAGRCPFHADQDPSLAINLETGLWHCHACGESGNPQTFVERQDGLDKEGALAIVQEVDPHYLDGAGPRPARAGPRTGYTVEQYAESKKLPTEFLLQLGVKTFKQGISIPYMDPDGTVLSTRRRFADTGAGPKFSWTRGSKTHLYGLWQLAQIRQDGYVILAEGESDCQTLWHHGYRALGVPGASTFKVEWVDYLEGLTVYVFQEPGQGGQTFVQKIAQALVARSWQGNAYLVTLLENKDPSELHCQDPAQFPAHWKAAMDLAATEPLDLVVAAGAENQFPMPDAPVQLQQPPGWRYGDEGIYAINDQTGLPHCVSPVPILLTRRLRSRESGNEKVELSFKRDGTWHNVIMDRSTVFQARSLPALADHGATVTSENARLLVAFLSQLEGANMDRLERATSVESLGWHGPRAFLPGHGDGLVLGVPAAAQQWVHAYTPRGSLGEWIEVVGPHRRDNVIFRFLTSAALAAPLLRPLRHRSFLVHNWGDTRIGKTAALKAALSAWGDPDRLLTSFYATKVGLERLAGFYKDLPVGVDERQVAHQSGDYIDSLAYMLTLGSSKVRGAKGGGLQGTADWLTIIMTTGEEPLARETSHGGMFSRVLDLHGAPFADEDSAQVMHQLESYGLAGPEFIARIMQTPGSDVRAVYDELRASMGRLYPDRVASHVTAVSAVAVADYYLHQIIEEPDDVIAYTWARDMGDAILGMLQIQETADYGARVRNYLHAWLLSNHQQFTPDARAPAYGFVRDQQYHVYPHILETNLERDGFAPKRALHELARAGVIRTERGREDGRDGPVGRVTIKTTVDGHKVRVIKVAPFDQAPPPGTGAPADAGDAVRDWL